MDAVIQHMLALRFVAIGRRMLCPLGERCIDVTLGWSWLVGGISKYQPTSASAAASKKIAARAIHELLIESLGNHAKAVNLWFTRRKCPYLPTPVNRIGWPLFVTLAVSNISSD
jgi:hypothetical protein